MPEPLLSAKNISLEFPTLTPADRKLMTNPVRFLLDFYFSRSIRKSTPVLEGICFDVYAGDRLGVLGLNGAGKSTLLRLLAGIYYPASGTLDVQGQAKGLFDVSMGMQAQATGLENIYLRGLQMGISLSDIKKKLPDILEFTELGDDIHKVFDTYSSGMRLRLAFAVSTMIEPDILLMDEWLGAGDARFKTKVKARMDGLVQGSRALVLASHSVPLLKQLCNKGLVLHKGKQIYYGSLDDAIEHYNDIVKPKT